MTPDVLPATPAVNQESPGASSLAALLRRAGVTLPARMVRAMIRGVAAAPRPWRDEDAWTNLIDPTGEPLLRAHLLSLVDKERSKPQTVVPRSERLSRLRGRLRALELSGLVVPRSDAHQGEYVPARDERLAWLTGFTGSAGTAVVLADRAALFVDGRYTEQAQAEVEGMGVEVRHSLEQPLDAWVGEVLPAGGRLGFDPWLHTPSQVTTLEQACQRAGGRLVAVAANPVDAVWPDQPPPPIAPVEPYSDAFAGLSSAEKRARIVLALKAERQDAAVLAAPDSIAWLLNIRGGDVPFAPVVLAFAIIDAEGVTELFIDPRKLTPAARDHLGDGVRIASGSAMGSALMRLGASRRTVRIDPESTPFWIARRLRRSGARVVHGPDPCSLPKAVKNGVEQAGIRVAHERDGLALCRFLAWFAHAAPSGEITEQLAAARLDTFRRADPRCRGLSFPTISAAGSHGAIVHYRVTAASNRRIEPGTLYLVDSGGQYLEGTTDVTRTVAVGVPDAEARRRFTLVLKGHIALATVRFPRGTFGSSLDAFARRALWQENLDYDHGTGHGVGCYLCVHEGPARISKVPNRVALEPGMVLSNEPGFYQPGSYGVRIENLQLVVRASSDETCSMLAFETLTLAPIDRALVDPDLLTTDEIAWLDNYHRRVREVIGPHLTGDDGVWLAEATQPIAC